MLNLAILFLAIYGGYALFSDALNWFVYKWNLYFGEEKEPEVVGLTWEELTSAQREGLKEIIKRMDDAGIQELKLNK